MEVVGDESTANNAFFTFETLGIISCVGLADWQCVLFSIQYPYESAKEPGYRCLGRTETSGGARCFLRGNFYADQIAERETSM